jgi:hypothetical protein
MPRYSKKPWFHPLGWMQSNAMGYATVVPLLMCAVIYPWRFRVTRYWERQRDTDGDIARQRAIKTYREIERHYKREMTLAHPMYKDDFHPDHSTIAHVDSTSWFVGLTDHEAAYWRSHTRDVQRCQQLLDEMAELKKKIESEGGNVADAWDA